MSGWRGRGENTYQTTAEEQDGEGKVLKVLGTPLAAPAAEMLEEDVGGAVEEDEAALDELGRRTPLFARLFRTHVPGLVDSQLLYSGLGRKQQLQESYPSKIAEAAGPAAEREDAQPEEDAALDPVRQTAEDAGALLKTTISIAYKFKLR